MFAYRQPSISEAAWLVYHSLTLDYRRDCLKYWRDKFGDSFALSVEREVRHQWRKRENRS